MTFLKLGKYLIPVSGLPSYTGSQLAVRLLRIALLNRTANVEVPRFSQLAVVAKRQWDRLHEG